MKWILAVLVCFFVISSGYSQQVRMMKIDDLEAYINKSEKPLLVNFWATWCKPCVEELPYFQSIINEKYAGEVELLLISLDFRESYPARLNTFITAKKITALCVWLNESNADMFCPRIDKSWEGSIPASLFVNTKTNYRKFHEGQLTPGMLKKELAALVN